MILIREPMDLCSEDDVGAAGRRRAGGRDRVTVRVDAVRVGVGRRRGRALRAGVAVRDFGAGRRVGADLRGGALRAGVAVRDFGAGRRVGADVRGDIRLLGPA